MINNRNPYIDLINRFWRIHIEANFSHLEVHLFFELHRLNNELRWKKSFQIANSRLAAIVGTTEKSLRTARANLILWEVIEYDPGSSNKAGFYSLGSFFTIKEPNTSPKVDKQRATLVKEEKDKSFNYEKGFK